MDARPALLAVALALPAMLLPAAAEARRTPCNAPKVRAGNFCVYFKTSNARGYVQLGYVRVSGQRRRRLALVSVKLNGPFTAPCEAGPPYQAPILFFFGGFNNNSGTLSGSNFSLHQHSSTRRFERHLTGHFISNTRAVVSWSETYTPSPDRVCTVTATNVTV
ncbi:MAG: hypothetical protein QOJ97_2704 [Solirubrobacteraceae bacterium]|jgi:hypothetical protein|nr:hypothetical protein [Solirubrobacteraceae bacterium]